MTPQATCVEPKPTLEDADDAELVARAWQGEDLALRKLLERYRPFVRTKARSYFLAGGDRDDVVQEGMIGLYKAVRDFDPGRQVAFRAFAELCVKRQILTAVKTATRHKHTPLNTYVSLQSPGPGSEDNQPEQAALALASPEDPADRVVSGQELSELQDYCCAVLSALEVQVLERYVEGQTYQEIAAELDRHSKCIDNALQRIKRKLDAYLADRRLDVAV